MARQQLHKNYESGLDEMKRVVRFRVEEQAEGREEKTKKP
jgi:hypothetical protein